jgi:hypothetical protein
MFTGGASLRRQFCSRNHALHFSIYCCSVDGITILSTKLQHDGESGRKKINQIHVG